MTGEAPGKIDLEIRLLLIEELLKNFIAAAYKDKPAAAFQKMRTNWCDELIQPLASTPDEIPKIGQGAEFQRLAERLAAVAEKFFDEVEQAIASENAR